MSIPALLHGLFDDAALFPPGNAPMPAAVTGHRRYGDDWYADLVGLFVCPGDRLAELDALAISTIEVSVTLPGGPADLDATLTAAGRLDHVQLQAVELPVPAQELAATASRLAESGLRVFIELPAAEVSEAAVGLLTGSGLGLKLRTGGASAAAFPSPAVLSRAIAIAVGAGARFKCTAGLHNAIAHNDPVTGFDHHGFINVLLAVHAAATGADPVRALAERDSAMLAAEVGELSPAAVTELRARFASIGSCSIIEPVTDLVDLGVVAAP